MRIRRRQTRAPSPPRRSGGRGDASPRAGSAKGRDRVPLVAVLPLIAASGIVAFASVPSATAETTAEKGAGLHERGAASSASSRAAGSDELVDDPAAAVVRGERVFRATGGCTCHTNYPGEGEDAPPLAGGRPLETPFGVFYSSNITPDPETGIGGWSDADFVRAMREGLSPTGEHYFPVFPYTSFSGLSEDDLLDLKAYLETRPVIARRNRPPDAPPPFRWRWTIAGWKWLNFAPRALEPDPVRDAEWNRGRYLVRAAAHCGECHTPRTLTGGLDPTLDLAGSRDGPEGERAPNITPDPATGIGDWTIVDLVWYLETGLKPEGDDTQGLMAEVIEHGYAELPRADRRAIAVYLKSLAPIEHDVEGDANGGDGS